MWTAIVRTILGICIYHYENITVTSSMRLKSPASQFFVQPFVQTQIKEDMKAPRGFPSQRASNAENDPFHDVIMNAMDSCRCETIF